MRIRCIVKSFAFAISMLLMFSVVVSAAGKPKTSAKGRLVGQFKIDRKTVLANGRLFLYDKSMGPPSDDRYVRVPDNIATLDKSGRFSLELPAGTYFLSAVKPPKDGAVGPPAEGEPIYFSKDSKGGIQPYVVKAGRTTSAGTIMSAFPYRRSQDSTDRDVTLIEGAVTDSDGKPVQGAVIYAYKDAGLLDKANYVSEKTDKDGRFILRVNEGGSYFLRLRGEYGGGMPKEGEFVSINDPTELTPVSVKSGERLRGVSIQAKRLPPRGPLFKDK